MARSRIQTNGLKVCLDTAYFAETEKLLLKVVYIKVKISWNSTVRTMNSVQKCSGVSGDATWRAGTPCPEKNNNKIKKIIYNSLNFLFVYLFKKK